MKPARLELLLILCLLAVAPAYGNNAARTDEPIRPVPAPSGLDPRKVALGSKLFSDPSLSRDGKIACASCHGLDQGGTDHRRHSIGVGGAEGAINAPSVFNSALNFREFWDGRAASLEAQVDGPLQASAEMGAAWPDVLVRLNRSPGYSAAFAAIYADGVSRENVKNAIAEFERSLVATNSRFDRWLRGDEGAIDAAEKAGYRKFKDFGCVSCHQGANVGGNMFQRMG
ncbi:MAG TPA: cytochrome c peroxidase, partial [Nevskiaceae bacterium]|nr:cytochrome c peroxidase [Nevskiaceae bacterium]